jgi:hypothetical protein
MFELSIHDENYICVQKKEERKEIIKTFVQGSDLKKCNLIFTSSEFTVLEMNFCDLPLSVDLCCCKTMSVALFFWKCLNMFENVKSPLDLDILEHVPPCYGILICICLNMFRCVWIVVPFNMHV